MDGAGPDEGRKRRLPLWMLGVAAADQVRKSDNGDENNHTGDGLAPQAGQPKTKTGIAQPVKEVLINDNLPVEVNSCFLSKCETKRRKRKSGQRDAGCDGNIPETGLDKKKYNGLGRTVLESKSWKRKKPKSLRFGSSEESEIPFPRENDGELTVEDLVSIAEEYVKADKEMEQQQLSNGGCDLESQLPVTVTSRNELGGYVNAPQTNHRLPTRETIAYSYNSTESSASEGIVISTSRTGDPAHDMLDLFLGPLLKKPLADEKKIESITKDMTFAYELRKQSQNDVVGEELVPRTKKKSSLKDKVAMLLD